MQLDSDKPLPPGERNALLILYSKENIQLKSLVKHQQETIERLQEENQVLRQKLGYRGDLSTTDS